MGSGLVVIGRRYLAPREDDLQETGRRRKPDTLNMLATGSIFSAVLVYWGSSDVYSDGMHPM